MARRATRDSYATERIGEVEVRRQVFSGSVLPANWELEEGSYEEVDLEQESVVGTTAQPAPDAAQQEVAGQEGTSQETSQEGQTDEELSGQELQERAKELGVKGRTTMSSDELRAAVAEAEEK